MAGRVTCALIACAGFLTGFWIGVYAAPSINGRDPQGGAVEPVVPRSKPSRGRSTNRSATRTRPPRVPRRRPKAKGGPAEST